MKGKYWMLLLVALVLCGCKRMEPGPVVQEFEAYCTMNQACTITGEKPLEMTHSGTAAITFSGTSGPTALQVSVLYKTDEDQEYKLRTVMPLTIQESFSVQLPEGVSYQIEATAAEGSNGYVTFRVAVE